MGSRVLLQSLVAAEELVASFEFADVGDVVFEDACLLAFGFGLLTKPLLLFFTSRIPVMMMVGRVDARLVLGGIRLKITSGDCMVINTCLVKMILSRILDKFAYDIKRGKIMG